MLWLAQKKCYKIHAECRGMVAAVKTLREWSYGGIAVLIHNLTTRWGWVVSFMPWLLYLQRKSPWYSLNRSLNGPQWWYWCFESRKISYNLLRMNQFASVVQLKPSPNPGCRK